MQPARRLESKTPVQSDGVGVAQAHGEGPRFDATTPQGYLAVPEQAFGKTRSAMARMHGYGMELNPRRPVTRDAVCSHAPSEARDQEQISAVFEVLLEKPGGPGTRAKRSLLQGDDCLDIALGCAAYVDSRHVPVVSSEA
jgi:hypothetical protein